MDSSPVPAASAENHPLTVTYRPIESLIPDPRNARIHKPRQVAQIAASIRAFGFTNPILADPEGRLIAGHGRLLAAKEAALSAVPVITLHGLSEAQKRALMLADNKIALNACWDMDLLGQELAALSLPELEIDIGLAGFSNGEIEAMAKARDVPAQVKRDKEGRVGVGEREISPRSRPGDIWRLGEHRIGCGDRRDADFLQALVGETGARFDDILFDIFPGLGTSLIAADRFRGFDSDPVRVDAAIGRWERLTGKTAERVPLGRGEAGQ
jgi:hypothetical protein